MNAPTTTILTEVSERLSTRGFTEESAELAHLSQQTRGAAQAFESVDSALIKAEHEARSWEAVARNLGACLQLAAILADAWAAEQEARGIQEPSCRQDAANFRTAFVRQVRTHGLTTSQEG